MRRLVLFATLFSLVLVLAPGAQAGVRSEVREFLAVGTEWLDLANGRGRAVIVRHSGAVYGSVGRGRVVITAPGGRRPSAQLHGCERRWRPAYGKIVCAGRDLRFAVTGDRRIAIRRRDIDVTAAMRGRVTLEGTAGTYSIGGSRARAWPRNARTFSVGG